ncbi:hypothetical protein ACFY4I_27900 [Streptomyces scabiei]|uniref:hypothetical protein n=1 Tax=Streptomyces scabiei TaxID=1930 RepID=UPI0036C88297
MSEQERKALPFDPRERAHQAGMELVRYTPNQQQGGSPPPTGNLPMPRGLDHASLASYFENNPFFEQGQTKRQRETRRQMHVISENEYILTESTIESEWFSFGRDIFMKEERK